MRGAPFGVSSGRAPGASGAPQNIDGSGDKDAGGDTDKDEDDVGGYSIDSDKTFPACPSVLGVSSRFVKTGWWLVC